jgi:hypothetical protein
MATTNLPSELIQDSAAGTKLFFDTYGQAPLEFNANDVSVCVTFFSKKGFGEDAAQTVSAVILKQAKLDDTPISIILDSLKNTDTLGLSQIVGEILNNNRTSISTLGFRTENVQTYQTRNIAP